MFFEGPLRLFPGETRLAGPFQGIVRNRTVAGAFHLPNQVTSGVLIVVDDHSV